MQSRLELEKNSPRSWRPAWIAVLENWTEQKLHMENIDQWDPIGPWVYLWSKMCQSFNWGIQLVAPKVELQAIVPHAVNGNRGKQGNPSTSSWKDSYFHWSCCIRTCYKPPGCSSESETDFMAILYHTDDTAFKLKSSTSQGSTTILSTCVHLYIQTLPYFSQKSAQNSLQYPQPNPSFEQQRTVWETRKTRKSKTMPESVAFFGTMPNPHQQQEYNFQNHIKGIQKETYNLLQQHFFICLWPCT